MRVFVTGGAGYIGSVVTEELLRAGHDVTVYDNLWKGHLDAVVDPARFVHGDVLDGATLRSALGEARAEAVVHMAGHSEVPPSVDDPQRYFLNNVVGGLTLLDAMRDANVRLLVYSSTASLYGDPERIPIRENDRTAPSNPYGATKLAFELALPPYAAAYGMKYVSLRYFNAAGASQRNGERHDPETHLVPLLLDVAAARLSELTLYGRDWPTKDGTCVRDYVHVLDLAQAHVLALAALAKPDSRSRVYNVGGGAGYTVLEVLDAVRRVTGRHVKVRMGPRRAGDTAVLVASSDRIKTELGWNPAYPSIDAIVASAWKWMQKTGRPA